MSRLVAFAALAVATGCSSNNSTGYGGNPPPPPPPPSGGHSTTITVGNNATNTFSPTPDTINAGTITFHWVGSVVHNVTWISGHLPLPTDSGDKMGGDPDYQAVLQAGQYDYHCTHHSQMTGRIVVLP